MKRRDIDREKAEYAFEKWWAKQDRYMYPIQCAWPEAYLAGLREGRKDAARKRKQDLMRILKK